MAGPGELRVHIVEGRPWKDAMISYLEPRSPYRPWHYGAGIRPGDRVVIVFDTDPAAVLTAVGEVGPDSSVEGAIRSISRWGQGLADVAELQAGTSVDFRGRGVLSGPAGASLVEVLEDCRPAGPGDRCGHSSAAAARILIASDGVCAGCDKQIGLRGSRARDKVHIHTVDTVEPMVDDAALERNGDDRSLGDIRFVDHPPAQPYWPADWPAVLCDACRAAMRREGFTSLLAFRFSRQPRCPRCGGHRSRSMAYGMMPFDASVNMPPWEAEAGCVVRPAHFSCGDCEHTW